ncbi:MAG: helix-turn-helix domain-containing protein [Candidatus Omnitrophota bacterium]
MNEVKSSLTAVLTTLEAARILHLSRRTLESLRIRGGGPRFVRISNRCVRYRPEDISQWLEERSRFNTSEAVNE